MKSSKRGHHHDRIVLGCQAVLLLCMTLLSFFGGCAFPPPVQTSVSVLLENPREYLHQRVEVSGTVEWGGMGHRDFEYWHFHLKKDGEEVVCYSEAYKYQVWATIDLLIRRAATESKEITVVGYLVGWGPGRSVLRAKWLTYEGRTYNAEFVPPAVFAVLHNKQKEVVI